MRSFKYLCIGAFSWICFSCSQSAPSLTDTSFHIENGRFVDAQRRTVILNGLNLVEKDPSMGYVREDDEKLFKQFHSWGVNCVRYGIHWDGLEPQPGSYNETYLKEIDKRVRWARENKIELILDMHQDLYSRKFGNGAPLWATLDEGLPHVTGSVWSDAYLLSPAVQKSFDNFWLNTPASDGIGIQDHYIKVWEQLARRYADSIAVIGFDIMNEPFVGSQAPLIFQELQKGFVSYLTTNQHVISPNTEVGDIWMDEQKRTEALELLDNQETFRDVLKPAEKLVNDFEENQLSVFYQKVRDAVRNTGNDKILFLEHNYFCNIGIESTFHFPLSADGIKDSLCAYAPHAYDLVVDTDGASHPGFNRLNTIFEQILRSSQRRNVPVVLGEWGAFYMGKDYALPALHHLKWIEQSLMGHAYWSWWPGIETQDYFHIVISRPYPQRVNGQLTTYHYDEKGSRLTCKWKENFSSAPTLIFLPNITHISKENIKLSPSSSFQIKPLGQTTQTGILEITPIGKDRELLLTF